MKTTEEIVTVYLGEKRERSFDVTVVCTYSSGDYWTPDEVDYEVASEVWDNDNCTDATELIKRYENIYKVDFKKLAIQEFINEY